MDERAAFEAWLEGRNRNSDFWDVWSGRAALDRSAELEKKIADFDDVLDDVCQTRDSLRAENERLEAALREARDAAEYFRPDEMLDTDQEYVRADIYRAALNRIAELEASK